MPRQHFVAHERGGPTRHIGAQDGSRRLQADGPPRAPTRGDVAFMCPVLSGRDEKALHCLALVAIERIESAGKSITRCRPLVEASSVPAASNSRALVTVTGLYCFGTSRAASLSIQTSLLPVTYPR